MKVHKTVLSVVKYQLTTRDRQLGLHQARRLLGQGPTGQKLINMAMLLITAVVFHLYICERYPKSPSPSRCPALAGFSACGGYAALAC